MAQQTRTTNGTSTAHCLRATDSEALSRPPALPALPPFQPALLSSSALCPLPSALSPILSSRLQHRHRHHYHHHLFFFFFFPSFYFIPFPSSPRFTNPWPSTLTCFLTPLRRRPGPCSRQGAALCAVLGLIAGFPLPQMLGFSLCRRSLGIAHKAGAPNVSPEPSLASHLHTHICLSSRLHCVSHVLHCVNNILFALQPLFAVICHTLLFNC